MKLCARLQLNQAASAFIRTHLKSIHTFKRFPKVSLTLKTSNCMKANKSSLRWYRIKFSRYSSDTKYLTLLLVALNRHSTFGLKHKSCLAAVHFRSPLQECKMKSHLSSATLWKWIAHMDRYLWVCYASRLNVRTFVFTVQSIIYICLRELFAGQKCIKILKKWCFFTCIWINVDLALANLNQFCHL